MWKAHYAALHESTFFIGMMILISNIGSRFIVLEFSKSQEEFFANQWVRKVFIFAAAFVATRDVLRAAALTLVFTLFVSGFFHESSPLCVIPGAADASANRPSQAEVDRAQAVLAKHAAAQGSGWAASQAEQRTLSGAAD